MAMSLETSTLSAFRVYSRTRKDNAGVNNSNCSASKNTHQGNRKSRMFIPWTLSSCAVIKYLLLHPYFNNSQLKKCRPAQLLWWCFTAQYICPFKHVHASLMQVAQYENTRNRSLALYWTKLAKHVWQDTTRMRKQESMRKKDLVTWKIFFTKFDIIETE